MPTIDVDADTYEKLAVSARLMDLPLGGVVRLLVQRLVDQTHPPSPATTQQEAQMAGQLGQRPAWLPVYKTYRSHMVEGEFNPTTMELRVSTAPWSGRSFPSPTAAARAVVEHFGSDERRTSNTNGRKFWRLTGEDVDLRSLVGVRI